MSDTPQREPNIRDFLWPHEGPIHLGIYSAIGRIVVQWGQLEHHFSSNILTLYQSPGGSVLMPAPPRQMKKKIEFWRKCFRELRELQSYQEEASEFADKFIIAKNDRDVLLHYNWGEALGRNPPVSLKGASIGTLQDGHSLMTASIDVYQLTEFTVRIAEINTSLLRFTFLLPTTPLR